MCQAESRAEFHEVNRHRTEAEARRLLAQRDALGARWLTWVAGELYRLSPPPYANMVRRELARLTGGDDERA